MSACVNCGDTAEHHHHVVPRSLGGVATVALCVDCHGRAHGFDRGYWRHADLVRASVERKRQRGECIGEAPMGWSRGADGRLVVDPQEAAVIARAADLRRDGRSMRAIVATLRADGVASRSGRPYGLTQVARMLADVQTSERPDVQTLERPRRERLDAQPLERLR